MPISDLVKLRKELHANPELSNKEKDTAARIKTFIAQFSPDNTISDVGGHGIIFSFKGDKAGPAIMVRCDMDALPILEINDFAHKSKYDHVAHKCGHDGHMAIVAGLAGSLHQKRPAKGMVHLLFQPAEETGEGALNIFNDPGFQELSPDYVFALHNLPGYEMHQIVIKDKVFNASVTSMVIQLTGKTAHAAEPEHGINPALAMAAITQAFDKHMINDPASEEFAVITPVYSRLGTKAYGTSAGDGEIHFTIRTWSQQKMNVLKSVLLDITQGIAYDHALSFNVSWTEDFLSNYNDPEANRFVREAAKQHGFDVLEKKEPFKWGEDFGTFTQKYKGAMFGLGAGKHTPALHNPDYDFPDEIIQTGVLMFRTIIDRIIE